LNYSADNASTQAGLFALAHWQGLSIQQMWAVLLHWLAHEWIQMWAKQMTHDSTIQQMQPVLPHQVAHE
jgi:hypothetical protein